MLDRFDIEARSTANPTKDQMRLMMQSLLVDRFKMKAHIEQKTRPVFELLLAKRGRTGPQLRPHPKDEACVALGAWVCVVPFLREHDAAVRLTETDRLHDTARGLPLHALSE